MLRVELIDKTKNTVSCGRAFVHGDILEDLQDVNTDMALKQIQARLAKQPNIKLVELGKKKKETEAEPEEGYVPAYKKKKTEG